MILKFKNINHPSRQEYSENYTIRYNFPEQRVKVYIESSPNLKNGFLEVDSGLYEIPWSYIGLRDNVMSLDDIFPEDAEIINSYVKIFKDGYNDKEVFGFLPPLYFRDKLNIPLGERTKSDLFVVSRNILNDLELQKNIKPTELRYKKRDLVLPEIIENYLVYKVPGKYTYLGEDDYNSNNFKLMVKQGR